MFLIICFIRKLKMYYFCVIPWGIEGQRHTGKFETKSCPPSRVLKRLITLEEIYEKQEKLRKIRNIEKNHER